MFIGKRPKKPHSKGMRRIASNEPTLIGAVNTLIKEEVGWLDLETIPIVRLYNPFPQREIGNIQGMNPEGTEDYPKLTSDVLEGMGMYYSTLNRVLKQRGYIKFEFIYRDEYYYLCAYRKETDKEVNDRLQYEYQLERDLEKVYQAELNRYRVWLQSNEEIDPLVYKQWLEDELDKLNEEDKYGY